MGIVPENGIKIIEGNELRIDEDAYGMISNGMFIEPVDANPKEKLPVIERLTRSFQ